MGAYDKLFSLSTLVWYRKGGKQCGSIRNIFSRCCGWCSLPLHYQMVRQRQEIVGNKIRFFRIFTYFVFPPDTALCVLSESA